PGSGRHVRGRASVFARRTGARAGVADGTRTARAVRLASRPATELQRPDALRAARLADPDRSVAVRAGWPPGVGQAPRPGVKFVDELLQASRLLLLQPARSARALLREQRRARAF